MTCPQGIFRRIRFASQPGICPLFANAPFTAFIKRKQLDRYLKKDKGALRLTGKSLTKRLDSLKSHIPNARPKAQKQNAAWIQRNQGFDEPRSPFQKAHRMRRTAAASWKGHPLVSMRPLHPGGTSARCQ
jgi:hypothetical protein